ncbi:MAG: hypothetical protein IT423_24250 [Pirellulaceae bacterium]|nr:hypothetical protein [Pirellulaceae bacterium]
METDTAIESTPLVKIFGVRHLSPMGAWQLRRFLDEVKPTAVLIEGLADAGDLIADITRRDTKLPIAVLAYTQSPPVRTLVYPLARYSPEYQALCWATEHDVHVDFIDLPSDVFLALQDLRYREPVEHEPVEPDPAANDPDEPVPPENTPPENTLPENISPDNAPSDNAPSDNASPGNTSAPGKLERLGPENRISLYTQVATKMGEADYESYWERNFEHNRSTNSYRLACLEFGRGLRELDQGLPLGYAENLVREAFMRRRIVETIAAGHDPEKIVAIVGAYHASALTHQQAAMTDDELASLKRLPSKLTLMPYSYFKLSSQSGYGAGNEAPAYFELIWDALESQRLSEVPMRYLTMVARDLRRVGTHRSTAEVIEGVRLARTLSAMKDGMAPTLRDLQDAAVTVIGHGERSSIQEALARVEVGTEIGSLPAGVSRTSIQDDFDRELERLKLVKYRTAVKQDLALDLRENRQAKSEASAFLDLHRSSWLHRLSLLGVQFGMPARTRQDAATWAENWILQWSPEVEIALVESVLLGETVELAASFKFKTMLDECDSIDGASAAVSLACKCGLFDSLELARARLQELATDCTAFVAIAHAANELAMVIRYGDVRRFDPQPLVPLVDQLFVQGSLALFATANCDNNAAALATVGMEELNRVSQEYHDIVDETLWIEQLKRLSDSDDRNPLLSGYACSILLERSLMDSAQLAREVSRRLSPGIPADLGAGWFEGMSKRNRYALLARQALWEQLADYVSSLDDEQFKRALVFLRRAFGNFSPAEKRSIAENLGQYWGVAADNLSELLEQPMTEKEEAALNDLNDFDFGDV